MIGFMSKKKNMKQEINGGRLRQRQEMERVFCYGQRMGLSKVGSNTTSGNNQYARPRMTWHMPTLRQTQFTGCHYPNLQRMFDTYWYPCGKRKLLINKENYSDFIKMLHLPPGASNTEVAEKLMEYYTKQRDNYEAVD